MIVSFNTITHLPVNYKVDKIVFSAQGGPKSADITVAGEERDLRNLLSLLGIDTVIADGPSILWRGYVHEIVLHIGKIDYSLSLDNLSNRIAVAYSEVAAGSKTSVGRVTDWVQNDASIRRYGTKELLSSAGGSTSLFALAERDHLLSRRQYPEIKYKPNTTGRGISASIYCKGYWSSLDWLYIYVPVMMATGFQVIGSVNFTLTSSSQKLAQAFDLTSKINVAAFEVYVRKIGSPGNLIIGMYTNLNDREAGESIVNATIEPSMIPTTNGWVRGTLTGAHLTDIGTYFLVASAAGVDDSNYYQFTLDGTQAYPQGPLLAFESNWSQLSADMPFRIYSNEIMPTEQQVHNMLVNRGQFFSFIDYIPATGYSTESARAGSTTALDEVERLLETGTSNGRRLLATVDEGRRVIIREEPDPVGNTYLIDRDLRLFDPIGNPIDPAAFRPGVWLRSRDMDLTSVETGLVGIQQAMFIEEYTYKSDGTFDITPSNGGTNIFGMQNG